MTTSRSRQVDGTSELLETIRTHELPEAAIPAIEAYEQVIGDRDRFLWRWAHRLFPEFTLSCVDPAHRAATRDVKLFGLIFVSILDDVAEMQRDAATFEEATKIPFDHLTPDPDRDGVDREVLAVAADVWGRFAPTLWESPRAEEFEALVRFDLEQVINSMRYSWLANRDLQFVNGPELRRYDAHNMMLYGFADVDLLHSPSFDRAETATLRRVVDRAQRMARIGNWITTWERELVEGDFTSGVVVHALENGIVSADELAAIRETGDLDAVDAVAATIRDHDVEGVFLTRWREELAEARTLEGAVDSVDVAAYLDGIETVMDYHLATRGLK